MEYISPFYDDRGTVPAGSDHGVRVSNVGPAVNAWSDQTGSGSSWYDLCEDCAWPLESDPHAYDGVLFPWNGDPVGEDGWEVGAAHPNFDDDETPCKLCGVLLTGW